MAAQHEVQRVEYHVGREHVRPGLVQIVILEAHPLDAPSCTPDVRLVGDAVGCFHAQFVDLFLERGQCLADCLREACVVDRRLGAAHKPAGLVDGAHDERDLGQQIVTVDRLAGGQQQLHGRQNLRDAGPVASASVRILEQ